MSTAHLPPMPWRLRCRDLALASFHRVDVQRARTVVPEEIPIVRGLPGSTVAGLFLAEYGPGSDLQYRELIVAAATVWHARRPAAWVTHLFVDEPASVEGGRALLGAPKHLAHVSWVGGAGRPQREAVEDREHVEDRKVGDDEGAGGHREVAVRDGGGVICRIRFRPRFRLWRQRLRLAAMHRDVRDPSDTTAARHGNVLRGRLGLASVEVDIPSGSPLRRLGLSDPFLGLCGSDSTLLLGGADYLPLQTFPVSPPPGGVGG